MSAYSVNVAVTHIWQLGAANTGLAGNMSAVLKYSTDGSSMTTSGVTVTITEVPGSAGDYWVTYTPTVAATYVLKVDESSNLFTYTWEDPVSDSPSVAAAANAFCTEADVVAWVQAGDYTGVSYPNETQVLGFMERRASELVAAMAKVMGDSVVYPSTIDETTEAGAALGRHLRMANSAGAAIDAILAGGFSETPARTERASEMAEIYGTLLAQLEDRGGLSRLYLGYEGRASTHVSTGQVTRSTPTPTQASEIVFTTETDW